jgi:hypothetical protein
MARLRALSTAAWIVTRLQLPRPEGVVEVGAHRSRHRPAALLGACHPVADARLAVQPVDAVGADHADDAAARVDDHRLQAVVVGNLPAREADEGQDVLRDPDGRAPTASTGAGACDWRR